MERKPNSNIELPPGFRFHPSDEELIVHYLRNKATSSPIPASIIAEVDLYKYNPWELPNKALFGDNEWYFFTPRDRKYPNGARPNRAVPLGFWKATGTDKPILTSCGTKSIGVKKALVFYRGRSLKGVKTDWIMHEYRLLDTMRWTSKRKGSMRLDDWVLCRVRKKSNLLRNTGEDQYDPSSAGYFPKENEPSLPLYDVARPMLPCIFATQDLPCETVSSISFQDNSNEKSCTSVCENNSDEKNLQFSVSSFDHMFVPLKRKPTNENENQYVSFLPPSKKLTNIREDEKEELMLSVSMHAGSEMNFCRTYQSEGNIFNADQWNSIIQYQELNHLTFTESD